MMSIASLTVFKGTSTSLCVLTLYRRATPLVPLLWGLSMALSGYFYMARDSDLGNLLKRASMTVLTASFANH